MVKICVVGCLHGELDRVYTDIAAAEQVGQFKTDLVLCCGDFQSLRNPGDLVGMSVPAKYYAMGDFWRYYAEERQVPILTLFVGGNHEASGYLQELPYGGWVAPNIWYMGYAGVVQFAGLRIAGLSGIYKQHDYTMGHFERPPYSEASKRSVYHVRNLEVFRLGQLRRPLDIVLSHDWPRGVYHYGDTQALLRRKRDFADEVYSDTLGSPPAEQLLCRLRPRYWFSAHLHCKFAAVVQHSETPSRQSQITRFLALDKCLPRRDYLQFVDVEPLGTRKPHNMGNSPTPDIPENSDEDDSFIVSYPCHNDSRNSALEDPNVTDADADSLEESPTLFLDPEWLCILRSTNHLMSTSKVPCILPGRNAADRCDFSASNEEIRALYEPFGNQFVIPDNFERTAPLYKPDDTSACSSHPGSNAMRSLAQQATTMQPKIFSNPQTELLCAMLDLINPNALHLGRESYSLIELSSQLKEKIAENDEDDDDEEVEEEHDNTEAGEDNDKLTATSGAPDAKHVPDPDASWITSEYSGFQTDITEYDPLHSVCMSPAQPHLTEKSLSIRASHNPEELNLDDVEDEDDEDNDRLEDFAATTKSNLLASNEESYIEAYSPQPLLQSFEARVNEAEDELVQSPGMGYVPSVAIPNQPSHNTEEIPLSGSSDESEEEKTM